MFTPLFESVEDRRFFSAGAQDTTFFNGQATESIKVNSTNAEGATNSATPRQVLVDSADRMLVVTKTDGYLVLRRFLPGGGVADGSFDQSVAAQPLPLVYGTFIHTTDAEVALDAGNRIYVLDGQKIMRYTSSGKVDRTFGHKGTVTLGAFSSVADFAINDEGQIYVVGTAPLKSTRTRMLVARLTSAGVLDAGFDNDGIYNAPVPGGATITNAYAAGQRIRVIPGGAIIVAGQTHFRVNIGADGPANYEADEGIETLKFRANGRLFADYGTNGVAFDNAAPVDISFETLTVTGIRNDGSVVLFDSGSDDSPDGGGFNGNVTVTNTGARGGAVDFGQLLYNGDFFAGNDGSDYYLDSNYHQVLRLTKTNTLDPTFNGGRSFSGPTAAAVAPDGRIFYAGSGNAVHDNKILIGALTTNDGPYGVIGSQVLTQNSRAFGFTVDWNDMDGVDADSINGLEIRISGGAFRDRPLLVSMASDGDGGILATYSLRRDSLRGAWTAADNGNYVVSVFRQTLKDDLGNFAPSTPIGDLTVNIA